MRLPGALSRSLSVRGERPVLLLVSLSLSLPTHMLCISAFSFVFFELWCLPCTIPKWMIKKKRAPNGVSQRRRLVETVVGECVCRCDGDPLPLPRFVFVCIVS